MSSHLSPIPHQPESFAAWLRERGWALEPLSAGMTLNTALLHRLAAPLEDSSWLNPLDAMPLWFTTTEGDPLPHTLTRGRQLAAVLPGAIVVGRSSHDDSAAIVLADASGDLLHWTGNSASTRRSDRDLWGCFDRNTDALALALDLRPRLARRDLSHRFFCELRDALGKVAGQFTGLPAAATEHRQALALTLCCRLMFLYFIQRKGWLDHDDRFLARQLLHPDHRDLFRLQLQPLFFRALNLPPDERSQPLRFRRIPYLNGGLFAPTALEQRYAALNLPDEPLRALLRGLFERYRFVESEQSADHDAIDPRMLGHVFERLMGEAQRSRSGTFYTPPQLARHLLEQTLRLWLTDREEPHAAATVLRALREPDQPLDPALAERLHARLDRLQVLDPACGSGACLLEAADLIATLRLRVAEARRQPLRRDEALRQTLTHNLFGIDLSSTAVALAELRLWLALAAATPDRRPEPLEPLPNLGHRLRHGDALFGHARLHHPQAGLAERAELAALRRQLAAAHGPAKQRLEQQCAALEQRLAVALLRAELAARDEAASRSLSQTSFLPDTSTPLVPLPRESDRLDDLLAAAERGDWVPAFDAALAFAEQLDGGGFDWVIGNPPWVRLSELPPEERRALKQRYRLLRSSRSAAPLTLLPDAGPAAAATPFGSQPDLSVAFVERALELCRQGGIVSLLLPAKLLRSEYGAPLRAALATQHTPLRIEDLSEDGQRHFGADTFPALLVVARGAASMQPSLPIRPGHRVELKIAPHETGHLRLADLAAQPLAPWPLLPPDLTEIAELLATIRGSIGDHYTPRMGIKTGANDLFVDPPAAVGPTAPLLLGRDLGRSSASRRLLFAYDTETALPLHTVEAATATYLAQHRDRLKARADLSPDAPLWLLGRVRPELLGHRVAWPDIARLLTAAALSPVSEGGPLLLNTVYYLSTESAAEAATVAAWLNTTPLRAAARWQAERALSGYRRYNAAAVSRLPLPAALRDTTRPLPQRFCRLAQSPADHLDELNAIACQLLGLSPTHLAKLRRFLAGVA